MELNEAQTVTPLSVRVSARVAAWLKAEERSQAWLARRTRRDQMWVHRRLMGKADWTVNDVELVAEALGVDAVDLVRDDPGAVASPAVPGPRRADVGAGRVLTVAGVAGVVVVALVVGWVAPYGVPVAALLAVGVLALLALCARSAYGRHPLLVVGLVVAGVVAAGIGVAVPADAHARHGHRCEVRHDRGRGHAYGCPAVRPRTTRPTPPPHVTPTLPTVRPTRPSITIPGVTPTLPTVRPTRPTLTLPPGS